MFLFVHWMAILGTKGFDFFETKEEKKVRICFCKLVMLDPYKQFENWKNWTNMYFLLFLYKHKHLANLDDFTFFFKFFLVLP